MAVPRPPLNEDAIEANWQRSVTDNINFNEERILLLLEAMQDLSDGSSVDQLRDAIIAALE